MIFATGITPNFEPRAHALFDSARKFGINLVVFLVNYHGHTPECCRDLKVIHVNYDDIELKAPKFMLQHGAFAEIMTANGYHDYDVVAFIDGDAYFQRALTDEELCKMDDELLMGEFLVGRNNPNPLQYLMNEATFLSPSVPMDEIERRFKLDELSEGVPLDEMICRNFGFVVATLECWKWLYDDVKKHWQDAIKTFGNAALVQWIACYCVQRYSFFGEELPLTIHAHGHLGLAPGINKREDRWYHNDTLVFYAHAL